MCVCFHVEGEKVSMSGGKRPRVSWRDVRTGFVGKAVADRRHVGDGVLLLHLLACTPPSTMAARCAETSEGEVNPNEENRRTNVPGGLKPDAPVDCMWWCCAAAWAEDRPTGPVGPPGTAPPPIIPTPPRAPGGPCTNPVGEARAIGGAEPPMYATPGPALPGATGPGPPAGGMPPAPAPAARWGWWIGVQIRIGAWIGAWIGALMGA